MLYYNYMRENLTEPSQLKCKMCFLVSLVLSYFLMGIFRGVMQGGRGNQTATCLESSMTNRAKMRGLQQLHALYGPCSFLKLIKLTHTQWLI